MEPTPPPAPISIPSLLTTLLGLVSEIQRKNITMINYYIHPSPTPTEIAAYEPRLLILRTRVMNMSQLSLPHLSAMIDDGLALVASYLMPNIQQLAAASMGVQKIFIEHYDRRLEQTLPYNTIFDTLQHYEQALHQFIAMQMNNPRRQPAENHLPPPSSVSPSVCRGAVAFLNNRDHGKVAMVLPDELLPQHRGRLADRGGVILYWECALCAYRLTYHASHSTNLNINQTDEVMFEDDVDQIAYRSAWLVKCHIYHPRQPQPASRPQSPSPPTSPMSPILKAPEPLSPRPPSTRRPSAPPKRVSFTRRRSSNTSTVTLTTTARVITRSPSPPPTPSGRTSHSHHRHRSSNSKHTSSKHPSSTHKSPKPKTKSRTSSLSTAAADTTGPHGLKYYCPFCIAQGKPMVGAPPDSSSSSDSSTTRADADREFTCFENSKELIEHVEDRHTRDRPVNLLLQRLKVAVLGHMAPGSEGRVARWDLDLR